MRKILLGTAALLMSAGVASADPLIGTRWQTNVDDGKYALVEMRQCGSKICGVFIKTFDGGQPYESTSLGKNLVEGMSPAGTGTYKGGTIWEPSSDKKYKSSMELLGGGKMRVKGCVSIICKKFIWTQAN